MFHVGSRDEESALPDFLMTARDVNMVLEKEDPIFKYLLTVYGMQVPRRK